MSDQSEFLKAMQANADALTRISENQNEAKARLLDIEQKMAHRLGGNFGGGSGGENSVTEMADLILKSDQLAAFVKGSAPNVSIAIPRMMLKTAILNSSGTGQPLVPPDYRPGIAFAPQRRLTIRDLFNNVTTTSNLVEFARELSYTNNAAPQGGAVMSPAVIGEGELKPESAMAFELAQAPVITLAHWIPASRQVLADAPALTQHLNNRLLYGLKLKEELEFLTGDGTVGNIIGLITQASAFMGGSTNLSPLDALALAIAQLAASEFTPTAFILNPADWFSDSIILKKDTLGNYVFGDPGEATIPSLWGLPCVLTNSMTRGKFMCLDAPRTGYVVDREDATFRIAEQHADFWIRNMCALLCEERVALIVEQPSAMVYGSLSNAG
jgi:HK97 family phage major capsid protein